MMKTVLRSATLLWLSVLASGAMADTAAAPSLQSYEAKPGDAALRMLESIFGGANGIFGASSNESVNAMFLAFNTAILAIAAAWFAWNVTSAIAQSSFDGEFLGKRYSTLWMPVRTVTGAAMLLPVWHGWNLAQLSMAYAASIGIGIGNTVMAGVAGETVPASISVPALPSVAELASRISSGYGCIADHTQKATQQKKTNAKDDPTLSVNWGSVNKSNGAGAEYWYGAQPAAQGFSEMECGVVRVAYPAVTSDSPDVQAVVTQARLIAAQTVAGLDSDLRAAYDVLKAADPDDPDQMKAAKAALTSKYAEIVRARTLKQEAALKGVEASQNSKMNARVADLNQRYGWLAAGAAGTAVAFDSISAQRSAPAVDTAAPAGNAGNNGGFLATLSDAASFIKNVATGGANDCSAAGIVSHLNEPSFIKRKCINEPIVEKLRNGGVAGMIANGASDPLSFAPTLGYKILMVEDDIVDYLFIASGIAVVVAALTPALSVGPTLSMMIAIAGFVLASVFIPLTMFALQLIVFVPMIISIAWVMAVGAWLVVVAESFVAAPLWALVHLDPEGDGMGQRTTHGYLFLLNLLFRPAILVFAAYFAVRFCGVIGGFANGLLSSQLAGMIGGASSSLFVTLLMLLGGIWLVTTVMLKVVSVSASLLSIIPNQVFTWIGGHFGSQVGSGVEGDVGHQFQGGASSAGGTVGNVASRAAGSPEGAARNVKEKFAANKADAELSAGRGPAWEKAVQGEENRMKVGQAAQGRFGGGAEGGGSGNSISKSGAGDGSDMAE